MDQPARPAQRAPRPSRASATVAAGRRIFTVQESFPRGSPRDGRNRIAASGDMSDGSVTVPSGARVLTEHVGRLSGATVDAARNCPPADRSLDPHPIAGRMQPDRAVPVRADHLRHRAGQRGERRRRRMAVRVAPPTSIAASRGLSRCSRAGSPGSALPWWATLSTSTGSSAERPRHVALGVRGEQHRERAELEARDEREVVRVAVSGASRPAARAPRSAVRPTVIVWPAAGVIRRERVAAAAVGSIRWTAEGQPAPPSTIRLGL